MREGLNRSRNFAHQYHRRAVCLKVRRSIISLLAVLLLFIVGIPVLLVQDIPQASALGGCFPPDFIGSGPYKSSATGFPSFGSQIIGSGQSSYDFYQINPGTSANMTFNVSARGADYSINLEPGYRLFYEISRIDAPWLSVTYSTNQVVLSPQHQESNVTMTIHVAEDAPNGDYGIWFGFTDNSGCFQPINSFVLRVGGTRPIHAAALSYISLTKSGGADAVNLSREPGKLDDRWVALEKDSSLSLRLNLTSFYPVTQDFRLRLANISEILTNRTAPNVDANITVSGANVLIDNIGGAEGTEVYRIDQHRSTIITLTFVAGNVTDGSYHTAIIVDSYNRIGSRALIESYSIPILVWTGKDTVPGLRPTTTVSTLTGVNVSRTTITVTTTATSTATLSATLTSTSTSTEVATDASTYAWAIGATIITALLAVVLLRRKR